MAITTKATVKTLLNITTTTNDAWIEALIPQVEYDYQQLRNKPFDVGTKVNITTTAALASDEEITIEIGNWAEIGGTDEGKEYDIDLRSGDTAEMICRRIAKGILPSPLFTVTPSLVNASSSSADLYFVEKLEPWQENYSVMDLTVEASTQFDATVTDMETIYPDNAELTAARMIQYHLANPSGVESERLGDYSISYAQSAQGYPRNIVGSITRYARTL